MKLGAKRAKLVQRFLPRSRVGIFRHEVAAEFFATNVTDPPHWTLNLCFGVIRTIWVHFGPFGFLTKIDGKRAVLVPKFVPQSRFGIFCNERILSTPLDPNLMFWCLSYYLGAFGTVWLSHESRGKTAELVQKSMKRSRAGNFHNERTRSTPSDPKLMFRCVLYYLGAFGSVWLPYGAKRAELVKKFMPRTRSTPSDHKLMFWCISYYLAHLGSLGCLTKLGAKWAELVKMFMPRSRVGIFRNERTRCTPSDHKLMFWCVSYYLGTFGTVWLKRTKT